MFAFDPEAAQALRQVGQLADGRQATADDLRRALEQPSTTTLPPSRLRADGSLRDLLGRASEIAARRGAAEAGRRDLDEALAEAGALAAGLDLERLRFARWRAKRAYDTTPRLRQHHESYPILTHPTEV